MLWKMLQELGYEKQSKYYGMQIMYEGSESMWYVQVYIFTPKPLRGIFEVEKIHATITPKHNLYTGICHVARQAYLVTRSRHRQFLDGIKYAQFSQ
jgi:hypothetical protein